MTDPAQPTKPAEAPQADKGVTPKRRFRRSRALFAPVIRVIEKIPHPPLRSKRGLFLLFLLVAGFGSIVTFGGVTAIKYTETASFCGRCHTMDPELKAYAMSPHKEVTCAECHVEPGAAGWIKAKTKGTKQLLEVMTGEFPTPIPPPDHAELPAVRDTCLKCHSLEALTEGGGPVKLVLRPRYELNQANTRETIAVMLRPGGLGEASGVEGVHWHVAQTVTYTSGDIRSRKIDLVEIKEADGPPKQYIAGSQVSVSTNVNPDIARLKSSQTNRRMDCVDCHNRIGHGIPSTAKVVDEAMDAGKISSTIPFVKRDGVNLLNGDYPSVEAADKAIEGLRTTQEKSFPLVFKANESKITQAIDELKVQYRLIATPAMKVQAKTYPDNLGHQTSPGCFRCHDGAHFLVVKGKITNKTIPSECSTCHTFPQVSSSASQFPLTAKAASTALASTLGNIPMGVKPANHQDKLWVFNHKKTATSVEPTGTSCAACHTRTYCENCHNSGAIKVKHDAMLYKHADAARASGGTQSCAYCHQPATCAFCHKDPVLGLNAPVAAIKARQTP
jgi:nitrate/TMAO reductase-like tetraheme cytochrome c subunit